MNGLFAYSKQIAKQFGNDRNPFDTRLTNTEYFGFMSLSGEKISEPIRVSTNMSTPARVIMGVVGSLVAFFIVADLGAALWPFNLFSLFFGFLILCGLCLAGLFVFGAIFGPNCEWVIDKHQLKISRSLRSWTEVVTFTPEAFTKLEIEVDQGGDGPDTFVLACHLKKGARSGIFGQRPLQDILRSPSFPTKAIADAALARFLGQS